MIEPPKGSCAETEPDRREKRRRAMIAAARALFLERGCDGVSLAEIVRVSGGSLATLYELFGNKQGLLAAAIQEEKSREQGRIADIIDQDAPPAAMLRAIAGELHDHFTAPDTTGLMRVMMAEGLRSPDFAATFYETVHLPSLRQLANLFETWTARGRADIPDPMLASQLFLGLLLHSGQMHAFFGRPGAPPRPRPDAGIDQAVRLFVAGYRIATA